MFFFFQAEDGIRDVAVTGVQTCALPIFSGSPLTAPRATNERSWLYRIRPTIANWGRFSKADAGLWRTAPCAEVEIPPAPMRWDPIPLPSQGLSLIEGIRTITTAGDAGSQAGMGASVRTLCQCGESPHGR